MDEYVMYHRLACWNPVQRLNTYREGCNAYPLDFAGFRFHGSYAYIGIASSFFLAPFQKIYDSLITAQLVGIAFIAAISYGISKSFKVTLWKTILILSLYFPLSYSIIHDGGPTRISLLAIAWTPFLTRRLIAAKTTIGSALLVALISLTWMIATEDKPFFLYLVPGTIAFSLASLDRDATTSDLRHKRKIFYLAIIPALACISLLLTIHTPNNIAYLDFLRQNSPPASNRLSTLPVALRHIVDWPFYAARIIDYGKTSLVGSIATGMVLAGITYKAIAQKHHYKCDIRNWLLIASFSLYWLMAWVAGGLYHHHFTYSQLPIATLLIAFIEGTTRQLGSRTIYALAAASTLCITSVYLTPKTWYTSTHLDEIAQKSIQGSPRESIVNCSRWGCYYAYSLSNNDGRPIVFADTRLHMNNLETLAKNNQRSILHLCWNCTAEELTNGYPNSERKMLRKNSTGWAAYLISPR